jgi:hypothetical protein
LEASILPADSFTGETAKPQAKVVGTRHWATTSVADFDGEPGFIVRNERLTL